jgi:hypothetical protein
VTWKYGRGGPGPIPGQSALTFVVVEGKGKVHHRTGHEGSGGE